MDTTGLNVAMSSQHLAIDDTDGYRMGLALAAKKRRQPEATAKMAGAKMATDWLCNKNICIKTDFYPVWVLGVVALSLIIMGNVSETPTPTTCPKSTAVHLQFVRQYAPHLYRRTFLASKLRRKGNPAIRLPFVLQYASHLYGSTPPICTAVLLEKYWGLGSPERF